MSTSRAKANGAKTTPSSSPAEVLTLAEAADYLRVSEEDIVKLVHQQALPGRLLGQDWRFLKSAVQDWLRSAPPQGSKEAILSVAGVLKDYPLEEDLKEISKRRGRGPRE